MPFKSEAQRRYMWSQHPEIAHEFEEKTHGKLPERKKKKKTGMGGSDPGASSKWKS